MDSSPHHDSSWQSRVRQNLKKWFRLNARDLPWRKTSDPYQIWLSEIMLQQTQVVTVVPYYERFVEVFPEVGKLAETDEAVIMRMWEGLGYYRRARQMHAASKVIVEQHGGKFPITYDEVLALPGVGRYTAGAILSIAKDQPLPILEGNTIRLHSRLTAYQDDVKAKAGQEYLWSVAEALVAKKGTGEINQALMELGATICLPRNPKCLICPLKKQCRGRELGLIDSIPMSKSKMKYVDRIETAILLVRDNRVLMKEYDPGERWAGLWDVPRYQTEAAPDQQNVRNALQAKLKRETGLDLFIQEPYRMLKHAVTRYRIQLHACHAETEHRPPSDLPLKKPWKWIPREELPEMPLSVTGRKLMNDLR